MSTLKKNVRIRNLAEPARSSIRGPKARHNYLELLKVDGWSSGYVSVNSFLKHRFRKSKSEASKSTYLRRLSSFCIYVGKNPDELVRLPKNAELIFPDAMESKVREMLRGLESVNCLNRRRSTIRVLDEESS